MAIVKNLSYLIARCGPSPQPRGAWSAISHIVLAACIVPLALMTIYRAWTEQFEKHVRIARWTLPLWLYVSVTGMIV
jgi:putative membrane protein